MLTIPKKVTFSSGFIFFLLILPIYFMNGDNWDGIHLEFANTIGDLSGIKSFLFQSAWYLQFYLTAFIILISDLFNLSYFKTNGLIVYIIFLFFLYENYFISKKIFQLSNTQNIWYLIFISTFPVFSTLSSSIMTFHFVCFTVSLFCLRIIHSDKRYYILILCSLLLLVSFNFNSLIVFVPILSICYDYLKNKRLKISLGSTLVFTISIIAVILRVFFLRPVGMYENYNSFSFSDFSFFQFIKLIIPFLSYPAILFILGLILILLIYLFGFKINKINKKKFLIFLTSILLPIIIFFFSILPYLIVNKTTTYAWNISWNSRQSILTCIPLGLLIILFFKNILNFSNINNKQKLQFFNLFMFIVIFFNLIFFSSFIFKNLNRDIFENKLIKTLRLNFKNGLDPGTVIIHGENIPGSFDKNNNEINVIYRFYELNYIFYKAFSKRDYLVMVNHSDIPRYSFQNIINKYAQSYENRILYVIGDNLKCHTSIKIETDNFIGKLNTFKNVFNLQEPTVQIKKTVNSCL